jgi:hypothetical protein
MSDLGPQFSEPKDGPEFLGHVVNASQVRAGDYLDSAHKVHVHAKRTRGDSTTLAFRLKGSKAPGVRVHPNDHNIFIWRRS